MPQKYIDINGSYVEADVALILDSTRQFAFSPDSLAQVLAYDATGQLLTVTVGPDGSGNSYQQTLTYTSGKVTGISAWVKQ